MMINPRKLLKNVKAILQDRVIALDYPWKAVSRYSQKRTLSSEITHLCESAKNHVEELVDVMCADWAVFKNFPLNAQKGTTVYWQNNYLPGLDIISLFAMIKKRNPNKIIEIGSGHSTAVMRTAILHENLKSKIICIDPSPRRELKDLADEWIPSPLEELSDFNLFATLNPGDVVFFDGSHISLSNTDVTIFFLEIMPLIPCGTYVCIHDIYLPYDYPEEMAKRGYNEQYLLALLLTLGQHKFEVIFPAYFTYLNSGTQLKLNESLWSKIGHAPMIEKHGGSFWFKIR